MATEQVTAQPAGVVWEAPPAPARKPPTRGAHRTWEPRLAPFRDRPGEWGRVPGLWSPGVCSHLKQGRCGGIDPTEWEFTARKTDQPGKVVVYARFIGAAS